MSLFQQRGNHIVGSFIGGTFLGVITAQIPGACIGGILALIYAIATLPKAEVSNEEMSSEEN